MYNLDPESIRELQEHYLARLGVTDKEAAFEKLENDIRWTKGQDRKEFERMLKAYKSNFHVKKKMAKPSSILLLASAAAFLVHHSQSR
jgi:hypothetical protein